MNRYDTELLTSSFTDMSLIISSVNDAVARFSKGGWIDRYDWPSRWKDLKAYLLASEDRYHEANIAGVKVLAGSLAGRILVTFSKKVHNGMAQVTVIGYDDEPDRGCALQSIAATPNEVTSMIDSVILDWHLPSFKPNDKAMIC